MLLLSSVHPQTIYKIASIAAIGPKTIVVLIVSVWGVEPALLELFASSTALGTHFLVFRRVTMIVPAPMKYPSPRTLRA